MSEALFDRTDVRARAELCPQLDAIQNGAAATAIQGTKGE